eukprot:8011374-Karenia_brevis.AAC.1
MEAKAYRWDGWCTWSSSVVALVESLQWQGDWEEDMACLGCKGITGQGRCSPAVAEMQRHDVQLLHGQ